MSKRLDDARNRLAEVRGRMNQASEVRSDPIEEAYYALAAINRLAEAVEAILDVLEPQSVIEEEEPREQEAEPECQHCIHCIHERAPHCCKCKGEMTPEERHRRRRPGEENDE